MKRVLITVVSSAMLIALPGAGCDRSPVASAGSNAVAQKEIDRAYVELDKLIDRVRVARQSGAIVAGSPQATAIADDIAATRAALKAGNVIDARAAMRRIEAQL